MRSADGYAEGPALAEYSETLQLTAKESRRFPVYSAKSTFVDDGGSIVEERHHPPS